jgi:hypothetical protein
MFREEKKFISKRCKIMIISVTLLAIVMIAWGVGMRISHTAHANIDDNDVVSTTTQYVSITTTDTATTTNTTATTETTDETTSTASDVATTTQTTIGYIRDIPTRNEVQDEEVVNNAQIAIVHTVEAITINDSDPIETINETVAIDTTTESTTTHTTTVVATSTDASTTSEEVTTDESTTTVEEVVTETVNEVYLGNFRITGYVATGCKTASGTWPAAGRTIAMNKSQMNALGLEYGDQIRVDGLGTYTLEDCGCKSGRIDVFCNSVKECYALPSYLDAYLVN